jgi:fucose 4-O-acetylase-like acetyltransferase
MTDDNSRSDQVPVGRRISFLENFVVTTANRVRITWVDSAKGVGIFLVVLGHTLRGLQSSSILPENASFRFVDSWIYSFHMPLFFLLSGLFAERRVDRSPGFFLKEKLETLAYPYLVWSTLQTLMQIALGRYTNKQTNLSDLLGILINPIMQFWFLYALFLMSLIYYFLRRCGLGPPGVLSIFSLFWASQLGTPVIPWFPLESARNQGLFYATGAVIDQQGGSERIDRARGWTLVAMVILGYGVVTASALRALEPMMLLQLAITFCGIAGSVALSVILSRGDRLDFLRVMGVYSLEIYVAHTIFSAGLRIVLQKMLKVQDVSVHLLVGTVGGIVLPMILAWTCRRFQAEFLFRYPAAKKTDRPS